MKKTLVVVANRAKAKLYTIASLKGPLQSSDIIDFPNGREHDGAFTNGEHGRTFESHGTGRSRYSTENSIDEQLVDQFTTQVVDRIEHRRAGNGFEHLMLLGEPKFIGHLKQKLSGPSLKLLLSTISRDVVDESESALTQRVTTELKEHPQLFVE